MSPSKLAETQQTKFKACKRRNNDKKKLQNKKRKKIQKNSPILHI